MLHHPNTGIHPPTHTHTRTKPGIYPSPHIHKAGIHLSTHTREGIHLVHKLLFSGTGSLLLLTRSPTLAPSSLGERLTFPKLVVTTTVSQLLLLDEQQYQVKGYVSQTSLSCSGESNLYKLFFTTIQFEN